MNNFSEINIQASLVFLFIVIIILLVMILEKKDKRPQK